MINESSSIQGTVTEGLKKEQCLLFALGKGSIFVLIRLHAATLFFVDRSRIEKNEHEI